MVGTVGIQGCGFAFFAAFSWVYRSLHFLSCVACASHISLLSVGVGDSVSTLVTSAKSNKYLHNLCDLIQCEVYQVLKGRSNFLNFYLVNCLLRNDIRVSDPSL